MSEVLGGANEMVRRFDSVSRRFTVASVLPNQDADGTMIVNSRTYEFPPHSRRPQRADESDQDYQDNVLAKGHAALTESGAFPDACAKTL